MGQNLTLPSIAIKKFTGIEQEQIKQTYQVLCQRSGTQKINQPTFVQYWTDYVDPIIADRLWLIFDTKFDSLLDFDEWATGLAYALRSNREDRLKLIGQIFDIDAQGYVIEKTLRQLFATNLFAARNIIKPFDWEAYEAAQAAAKAATASDGEFVKALYDYDGTNDLELSFKQGTVMRLLEKVDSDWWWCDLNDVQGYVPTTYIEVLSAAPQQFKGKQSKFQTVKRGTEIEVLVSSLLKLANKDLGGKIPKDTFLNWALEHEMDLCFNALEKFDLRPPAVNPTPKPTLAAPTPSQTTQVEPASTQPKFQQPAPVPTPTPTVTTTVTSTTTPTTAPSVTDNSNVVSDIPVSALRPSSESDVARITPELATILRAAGIADKELDDSAMAAFVEYFINKHAPTEGKPKTVKTNNDVTGRMAGRRRKAPADSVLSRPLPSPSDVPVAPPAPVISVKSDSGVVRSESAPLLEEIKKGKKLRSSQKKTNLATLSKKDLMGLGLLLRTQIDSRRNLLADSSDESSNSDFDD